MQELRAKIDFTKVSAKTTYLQFATAVYLPEVLTSDRIDFSRTAVANTITYVSTFSFAASPTFIEMNLKTNNTITQTIHDNEVCAIKITIYY